MSGYGDGDRDGDHDPEALRLMREYLLTGLRFWQLWDEGRGESDEALAVKTRRGVVMWRLVGCCGGVEGAREAIEKLNCDG